MSIDLDLIIRAYANGIFPMSDARDDPEIFWVEPQLRAVIPLDRLRVSRSLAKVIRKDCFRVTCDYAFADVIALCAQSTQDRDETWINADIETCFLELHKRGMAHSVECWIDDRLVGGLYGLALGRAFFGESMFSRATDASKVALAWLVARMRIGGYQLLDCQFMTDHLASLGAVEMPQSDYLDLLAHAVPPQAAYLWPALETDHVSSAPDCAVGSRAGAELLSASGDWAALDSVLVAPSPVSGSSGLSASSPGNVILQALT